jgi:adenylylsulfate kinase
MLSAEVKRQLEERGVFPAVLESDPLRRIFSRDPDYSDKEREYFYGSLAFIGATLVAHGVPVLFDATANRRAYRDRARQLIPAFLEVFVDTPLEVCMQRDPKGIYRMAQNAQAQTVPGLQAAYEPPENPELVIRGDREDPVVAARRVIHALVARGLLRAE